MAFDAYNLIALTKELSDCLVNGKINKICMHEKDEIILNVYNKKNNYKLLISVNASSTRIHITQNDRTNPQSAFAFNMLLRKYILNSTIMAITQQKYERVVDIALSTKDELGFASEMHLIVELTGKTSNILLCDASYKIIDTIKHFALSDNLSRPLIAGAVYTPAIAFNKLTPEQIDLQHNELSQYVADNLLGVSFATANEILSYIDFNKDKTLQQACEKFINKLSTPCPNVVIDSSGKVKDIYATNYSIIYLEKIQFESLSLAFDYFYSWANHNQQLNEKTKQVSTIVKNAIARTEKKLAIQMQELINNKDNDYNRICGDLILANIHNITGRTNKIEVINYYSPSQELISIELDTTLSPQQNAQLYYKKFSKQKKSIEHNNKLVNENTQLLEYLNSILLSIKQCVDINDINDINTELVANKLTSKISAKTSKTNNEISKPLKYIINGFRVYVGKNNIQNEQVTFKLSSPNDIWCHTRDIHSSHILIATESKKVPDNVILAACELAAFYSQAANSSKIAVDYTLKKYVKKPKNSPLGFVIYTNQQTIIVDPNKHTELITTK